MTIVVVVVDVVIVIIVKLTIVIWWIRSEKKIIEYISYDVIFVRNIDDDYWGIYIFCRGFPNNLIDSRWLLLLDFF